MYELKVETDFAAAHQLTMVGEKCENLHGHNWKIEVIVAGETLDEGGIPTYSTAERAMTALNRLVEDHLKRQTKC